MKTRVIPNIFEQMVVTEPPQVNDLDRLKLLFEQKGLKYRIAGHGPMISSPLYTDKFVYVPKDQDDSIIPQEGLNRLEMVNILCDVKGVIIGHELKIENEEQKNLWDDERVRQAAKWVAIGAAVGVVLAIGGYVIVPAITAATTAGTAAVASTVPAASVATTAAGTGLSTGTLALGAAVALMAVDPFLICCLSDPEQTWVELYFWAD